MSTKVKQTGLTQFVVTVLAFFMRRVYYKKRMPFSYKYDIIFSRRGVVSAHVKNKQILYIKKRTFANGPSG